MPGEFSKASGRALWKTIKDKNTSPAGGSTRDERLAGWLAGVFSLTPMLAIRQSLLHMPKELSMIRHEKLARTHQRKPNGV